MVRLGKNREESRAAKTPLEFSDHGRFVINRSTTELAEHVGQWRQKVKALPVADVHAHEREVFDLVDPLPDDVLAFCVVEATIRSVARGPRDIHYVVKAIARGLEEEIVFRELRREDPKRWNRAQKRWETFRPAAKKARIREEYVAEGHNLHVFNTGEIARLGQWWVTVMRHVSGVIDIKYHQRAGRWFVRFTDEFEDWVERTKFRYLDYRPKLRSCVDEPLPWESVVRGGYHSLHLQRPFVITKSKKQFEWYKDKGVGAALTVANYLQSVAFRTDSLVVAMADHYIEHDIERAGLAKPKPRRIEKLDRATMTRDQYRWAKERNSKAWRKNEEERGKRAAQFDAVKELKEDEGKDLFFVHRADFRGRLYPVADTVHYQGGDLVRGALRFKEGKVLETARDLDWLRIGGANLYGKDKLSFTDRIKWVVDNESMIEAIADDPLDCRLWEDADEPFQFLGWCADYVEAKKGNPSHHPVSLDGTNNGLQLWALCLRDPYLARLTNLMPVEQPEDIYQAAGDRALQFLEEAQYEDPKAQYWLEVFHQQYGGKVPRGLCKRSTMTFPYNVSEWSSTDYINDWVVENMPHLLVKGFGARSRALGRHIWQAIEDVLHGAVIGREWLKESVGVMLDHGVEPTWTSPSGFPVRNVFQRSKKTTIKLTFGPQTHKRAWHVQTDKVDRKKTVNAIAPNFIHSLDAAFLHNVGLQLRDEGLQSVRFVHDCFGVHACHAGRLSVVLREQLHDLFVNNPLEALRDGWSRQAPVPELPNLGTFDVTLVKKAIYAFA